MIVRLFRRRDRRPRALYAAVVAQARHPALYRRLGVADSVDGRFDMIVLHAVLVFRRLREAGPGMAGPMQDLLDLFLSDMDGALREMGVGDLAVPRRMRDMAAAFYGRLDAYIGALDDGSQPVLAAAIARNVFAGTPAAAQAAALSAYGFAAAASLAGQGVDDILSGRVAFADPADFATGVPA